MIFINLKTYPHASGENAVHIARHCVAVQEHTKIPIIPIVQAADLWRIYELGILTPWAQHTDYHKPGAHTGWMPFETIQENGAGGTLLNHSEHQLSYDSIEKTVNRIRTCNPDFQIILCATDIDTILQVKSYNPDYIAFEPPDIIGSATESVATKYAELIADAVHAARPMKLIVGAGIKNADDVRISLEKGAVGVLVASAVTNADNPRTVIEDLAHGFSA